MSDKVNTSLGFPEYWVGVRAGLCAYAWWKDGVEYVGTCGTTLKEALDQTHDAEQAIRGED